jgi:predicted Ser/Thr protein kinase
MIASTQTFEHVTAELAANGPRATGAIELSHGANAIVYSFLPALGAAAGVVDATNGDAVPLCDVVIKVGKWPSAKAFAAEVALHRTAAAAGCAPRLYYASRPVVSARTARASRASS